MAGSAILREVLVQLGLDIDEKEFDKAVAKGELVAHVIEKTFEKAMESAEEFIEKIKETAEAGHKIEQLAQQTGLETNELQNLLTAASLSGVAVDTMSHGILILSRNMFAAKKGSDEAAKAFAHVGVKVKGADGKLRSASDVMLDLADHFSAMPDGAEKTAQAMQLLGRNGAQLIPLLNKGREELAELANESPNFTEEQIEASTRFVHALEKIKVVGQALWQQAIAPLLPALAELAERFLAWRKENAKILRQRLQVVVQVLIKGIKILGGVMSTLFKAMNAVSNIVHRLVKNWPIFLALVTAGTWAWFAANEALITTFVGMKIQALLAAADVAAAWIAAAAPFLAIGAILTGLYLVFDDIATYARGGDSLFGRFKKQLDAWMEVKYDDPFWLIALKEFVHLLEKAIDLLVAFDDAVGVSSPVDRYEKATRKIEAEKKAHMDKYGRYTGSQGEKVIVPNSGGNVATVRHGAMVVGADAQRAANQMGFKPSVSSTVRGAGGGTVTKTTINHVKIDATHMTPEQLKPVIKQSIQEHEDEANESTAASFPSTP